MDPHLSVAPDGSPVAVFDALPPGPALDYVRDAVEPGASILDLGCGAGRLITALADAGHPVTGVDICADMLACFDLESICADIRTLDLGRTFGGVVLASYLVNDPDEAAAFVSACRRHVAVDGAVVVQRYDPLWAQDAVADVATVGNVTVSVHDMITESDSFAAMVTYGIGVDSWDQRIRARIVSDSDLEALAAGAGLQVDRWLDEHRTWARLIPV
jgi:SAM-dependent methyltransferase